MMFPSLATVRSYCWSSQNSWARLSMLPLVSPAPSVACMDMYLGGVAYYLVDLIQDLVACLQVAGYLDNMDREDIYEIAR